MSKPATDSRHSVVLTGTELNVLVELLGLAVKHPNATLGTAQNVVILAQKLQVAPIVREPDAGAGPGHPAPEVPA